MWLQESPQTTLQRNLANFTEDLNQTFLLENTYIPLISSSITIYCFCQFVSASQEHYSLQLSLAQAQVFPSEAFNRFKVMS